MNELIEKLLDEAELDIVWNQDNPDYKWVEGTEESLLKFAELIVRECVNAVMDGTKEGDHYAMRIERHFDNGPSGILQFGVAE